MAVENSDKQFFSLTITFSRTEIGLMNSDTEIHGEKLTEGMMLEVIKILGITISDMIEQMREKINERRKEATRVN